MKFAIAALLGSVAAIEIEYLRYLSSYGKSYLTTEEYQLRKAIYESNME